MNDIVPPIESKKHWPFWPWRRTAFAGRLGLLAELEASTQIPRLLRVLMIFVAIAVSLAAMWAYNSLDAIQDDGYDDFEILNLAGRERMLSQRIAQLSWRAQDPAQRTTALAELRDALVQLNTGRTRLQTLPHFVALGTQVPPIDGLAQAAKEVFAQTGAAQAVTVQADSFLLRMESVTGLIQLGGRQAMHESEAAHARYMTILALAISALALGSGEWFARILTRQRDRLRVQATELGRLALVAERTQNAVIIADSEGRMTWGNDAFTTFSGYSLAEALGRTPGSLLQFEGTDLVTREKLRIALFAHQPIQVDILNRSKQGQLHWLHMDIQPLKDDGNTPAGFVAVITDITSQVVERERLASLLRVLPSGVVQHDCYGSIKEANPEACRILGMTREQLLGREPIDPRWRTVYEDGSPFPGAEHPASRVLRHGHSERGIMMGVALPEGERRWLRVNAEPVHALDDSISGVVSSFTDITEANSQRRLLTLTVNAAGLGTWDWDIPTGAVQFNDRWWHMLGYRPGDLPATLSSWESLLHPDDKRTTHQALQRHFADPAEPYRCEFRMRKAQGGWVWIMAAGSAIELEPGKRPQRMAGIHLDITERKHLEQALSEAALTDSLTGLPNRSAFQAQLARCNVRAKLNPAYRYALLFMDFDRFKQVNDSMGHESGDELLRQIAGRLRNALRPSDDLARLGIGEHTAARLGGDEFVALLEALRRPEDAIAVAQRLLEAMALPYELSGHEVRSSVSIGIVTSDRADRDPEAMLRDADIAMYEAKRRGRGRYVVFSSDMHERVQSAMNLEADMRQALKTDGEIFVVYQPIVEMNTGRVCGVEALARWIHPLSGAIPPVEFIPLAEETGLISELGEYVLATACRDAVAWQCELGDIAPTTVSVNLSRAQIGRGNLTDKVSEILAETGLPAHALRLEITESLAVQDAQMIATLHGLRALGVSLSLDDFGTGYSSLASLDQLPLDAIKIDRSFVQQMVGSRYQIALIEAILKVAKSLNLDVVAEGVETEEQAQALRNIGCELAQGWLFGRPVTASGLKDRLRKILQQIPQSQ